MLAITGIILGVSLGKNPVTPVGPSTDDTYLGEYNDYLVPGAPEEQKPTFMAPVAKYTLGMDYSRDSEYVLVFKKTLNEWSVHNGVDFLAEEGTDVVAICDGTVTSVRNEYGMGNIVEITHADGLVSTYFSLGDEIDVEEGDKVKKGQPLIRFELEAIKAEGYPVTTPVIVCNTDDYAAVEAKAGGTVKQGDALLELKR